MRKALTKHQDFLSSVMVKITGTGELVWYFVLNFYCEYT